MDNPAQWFDVLSAAGYHLAGGDQEVTLTGTLQPVVGPAGEPGLAGLVSCEVVAGTESTASTSSIASTAGTRAANRADVADIVSALASGAHPHLVPLAEVLEVPGVLGDDTGFVLIWAVPEPCRSLRELRHGDRLEAGHVTAVLIAAARALISLEALGLSVELDVDDLVLMADGSLRVLPWPLSHRGTADDAASALRQVARAGQALLAEVGPGACPDLAHLLTATVFEHEPLSPGSFAAVCHDLMPPLTLAALPSLRTQSGREGADSEAERLSRAGVPGEERYDAARYEQMTRAWRDRVRAAATQHEGRSRARRRKPATRRWRLRSVGGVLTMGAVVLACGGAAALVVTEIAPTRASPGSPPAELPHSAGTDPDRSGRATPSSREHGNEAGSPAMTVISDPAQAAMFLTEERIRILVDLLGTADVQGVGSAPDVSPVVEEAPEEVRTHAQARLADVLLPGSAAMSADLHFLRESSGPTEALRAIARSGRTLEHVDDLAVVEVSYDLVSGPERISQSAVLTLTRTSQGWRVGEVSGGRPSEQQL